MPIRFQVNKETGQGEHIMAHVEQCNPVTGAVMHANVDEMAQVLDRALAFTDVRLHEMNMRHLEAYHLESYFEPGEWMKVLALFDILAGRTTAAMVKHRWDSIREENAALQAGREAAQVNGSADGSYL